MSQLHMGVRLSIPGVLRDEKESDWLGRSGNLISTYIPGKADRPREQAQYTQLPWYLGDLAVSPGNPLRFPRDKIHLHSPSMYIIEWQQATKNLL